MFQGSIGNGALLILSASLAQGQVFTETYHIVWDTWSWPSSSTPAEPFPMFPQFDERNGTRQLVDAAVGFTGELFGEFEVNNSSTKDQGFEYIVNSQYSQGIKTYYPQFSFLSPRIYFDSWSGHLLAAPGNNVHQSERWEWSGGYQEARLSELNSGDPRSQQLMLASLTGSGEFGPSSVGFGMYVDTWGLLADGRFGSGGVFPESWSMDFRGRLTTDLTYYYVPEPASMGAFLFAMGLLVRGRAM